MVLFAAGATLETHLADTKWTMPYGWLHQDTLCFFSMFCASKIVLGLEYLALWQELNQPGEALLFQDFFPYVKNSLAGAKHFQIHVAMEATRGSRPLLIAPWVVPSLTGTPDFNPHFMSWEHAHHHPNGEPVPLQDFAAWVGAMSPGKIVFSSHRSKIGDLYWRLEGGIVIFSFLNTLAAIQGSDVQLAYRTAVGEPSWWNVPMVSQIVLSPQLSSVFEGIIGKEPCTVINENSQFESCGVQAGSEIIIFGTRVFENLLGTLKGILTAHAHINEQELMKAASMSSVSPRNQATPSSPSSPSSPSHSPRRGRPDLISQWKPPAGAARNVASSRRRTMAGQPKVPQLEINMEALRALLQHVHKHTQKVLDAACDVIEEGESASRPLSRQSSRGGSRQS